MRKILKLTVSAAVLSFALTACGGSDSGAESSGEIDPMSDKGVGPVSSLTLGELDAALASSGEKLFNEKCSSCHKMEKRYIGPALAGVTQRRTPEWVMNMILNPEGMVQENEAAKKLLMEYSAPMANQSLTEDEARSILEYFRKVDSEQK
ncbi:MAG: cytochrome c [Spirochaetia bacterium]|nr:cytochrome c [Spirochaetia bacterium]